MEYFDGSYLERWAFRNRNVSNTQTEADAITTTMQIMREALLKLRAEIEQVGETGAAAAGTVELDQTRVGRLSRMDALQALRALDLDLPTTATQKTPHERCSSLRLTNPGS